MRKKFTISIFVVIILVQISINFIIETIKEYHKENIIENVISKLPAAYLTKINASNSNITWIEHGKEFILNGEMYDVVTTRAENSTTVYYCFSDKNEDQLIKKYEEINDSHKPTSETGAKQIASFFTIDLFCSFYSTNHFNSTIVYINSLYSVESALVFPTSSNEILIPPPQLIA